MILVNQAEFARMHGVSRKTVTKWKAAGLLVFRDVFVDLKRTDARLEHARLGRFKGPQGNNEAPEGNSEGREGNRAVEGTAKGGR